MYNIVTCAFYFYFPPPFVVLEQLTVVGVPWMVENVLAGDSWYIYYFFFFTLSLSLSLALSHHLTHSDIHTTGMQALCKPILCLVVLQALLKSTKNMQITLQQLSKALPLWLG